MADGLREEPRIPLPDTPCAHCDTFGWCAECGCVATYEASARQLAAFEDAVRNLTDTDIDDVVTDARNQDRSSTR